HESTATIGKLTCYSCGVDVERTIQFILRSQAKAEARQAKMEARTNDMEKRLDRRMDAITKLWQQGMRMLDKTETKHVELADAQKELADAQKATDRTLKAFINSLRNGRNGR